VGEKWNQSTAHIHHQPVHCEQRSYNRLNYNLLPPTHLTDSTIRGLRKMFIQFFFFIILEYYIDILFFFIFWVFFTLLYLVLLMFLFTLYLNFFMSSCFPLPHVLFFYLNFFLTYFVLPPSLLHSFIFLLYILIF
jgi:hypothetical protein